ncbi:MAG TPA: glycoside hydrolase family 16 protein [Candidatus Limnocylindrales bacterium]
MSGPRVVEFHDGFETGRLDADRWVDAYLPQWSSRRRAAPTWAIADGRLVLEIPPEQEPWCPEWDGDLRVSSIQTGVFAGPLGSPIGQHRFAPDVVVREAQEERRQYTPRYGRIEIRAAATAAPGAMVALWMIGFEDRPDDSGEICVMEIFSRDIGPGRAAVGMGVHPHHDPRLVDDFERVEAAIDATEAHDYAAEWTPAGVAWEIDGRTVRTTRQSPGYPMQLMLGLYAFGPVPNDGPRPRFVVESVRGIAPAEGRTK